MQEKTEKIYRKAIISDVKPMQKIINNLASQDEMLPRSLNQIYETLRDFWVCIMDDTVCGCCALHIMWEDLAEIRSVAIPPEYQRQGIGKKLVQLAISEALELGLPRIFLLTYKPEYFKKHGFHEVDKNTLPHKVWRECINCPKFPDCGEVAMIRELQVI